ncbi:zinc-binding protein [Thalassoglobus neptunius]|uniref:DNA gyrase inhibitor YacG n=1 Tax=Thalassoglobus neptunius TaxID=1938619 RepID=A0A5C5X6B0_9PLAN|nr:DNA gyrase inhibitor YacG [Thalassoglobus neptunius]TWT57542.1 zinc-binding protein [Thalassoglobus neptunius]
MISRLTCPICKNDLPVEIDGDSALFPFCSKRCKYVDLNRWMTGEYMVVEDLSPEQIESQLMNEEFPPEGLD